MRILPSGLKRLWRAVTRRVDQLPVFWRLMLPLALPFMVVAWVTFFGVKERYAEVAELSELEDYSLLAESVGELVHELQHERGLMTAFVAGADAGEEMSGELVAQRQTTRRQARAVLDELDGHGFAGEQDARTVRDILRFNYSFLFDAGRLAEAPLGGPEVQDVLAAVAGGELVAEWGGVSGIGVAARYTEAIWRLNRFLIGFVDEAGTPRIARKLGVYFLSLQYKDVTGLERAVGARPLAGERTHEETYHLMRLLAEKKKSLASALTLVLQPSVHDALQAPGEHLFRSLGSFRWRGHPLYGGLLSFGGEGRSVGAPLPELASALGASVHRAAYWDRKTEEIDAIREFEQALIGSVRDDALADLAAARWELARYVVISPLVVLLAVLSAYLLARRIHQNLDIAETVFARTGDGIVVTDPRGRIVEVNRAFTQITGYERDEVLGRSPGLLKSEYHDPAFYKALWRDLEGAGFWQGQIWNRRKDGELFTEWISINAVHDRRGRIRNYVGVMSDISALTEAHRRELEQAAYLDPVTGLPNHLILRERLEHAIGMRRPAEPMVFCYVDLSGLREINDRFGRMAGDRLLQAVARRLKEEACESEVVARIGSDKFGVILDQGTQERDPEALAQRIASRCEGRVPVDDYRIWCTARVAVVCYPEDTGEDVDSDRLLNYVRGSLERAKHERGARIVRVDADEIQRQIQTDQLVQRLEKALEHQELFLLYQPKVAMTTGTVIGVEALLRWEDPERGFIPPGEFMPVVESHPISVEIGLWVLREAARQAREWRRLGASIPVSINVNALLLHDPRFLDALEAEARTTRAGSGPVLLELEILESSLVGDLEHARTVVDRIRELDVPIAIDDFGTGFASYDLVKYLTVDQIKIDRVFVQDMLTNEADRAVVRSTVEQARIHGCDVLAEGVETVEHGHAVIREGCSVAQGFGIAPPMKGGHLLDWERQYEVPRAWRYAREASRVSA